ncbi:MAG: hypothetical protein KKG53_06445 [Proteobacteria bacterium]|nr:hypothetical protein [Pseudomonadota bacterium]
MSTGDDNSLILAFNTGEKIKILTTGDVDLSEYVTKLTHLIDKKIKLDFTKHTFDDSKFNLIQDTIEKITGSFNETVEDEIINEDAVVLAEVGK